ncbi:MAG: amidohydrolase family protein, partial [Thermoleophilia bacterium]|nr:amidohydrolase family protein [Thermoleophilia bacterium]
MAKRGGVADNDGGATASPTRQDAPGVIDAHVHVFPPEMVSQRERFFARDEWFRLLYGSSHARMVTVPELLSHMDAVGVKQAVVFGFPFKDQALCRLVNDYVLSEVRGRPERLVGLACVSPEKPGAAAELERCLDGGLVGCGELSSDGQGFTWEGLRAVAGVLVERGRPLLLHASEPVG